MAFFEAKESNSFKIVISILHLLISLKPTTKVVLILASVFFAASLSAQQKTDTTYIRYPAAQQHLPWHHRYDQTLVMKLMMSTSGFDGKYKTRDNGSSELYLTFKEALDIIRRLDNFTLGMPKIVYLVGWQYNGHDSKYPAWFEGNEKLKRKEDKSALESLRWLMREAKRYHTIVSLHINMFDAYADSPLWDEYVKNDIIAKNKDGSLLSAEWGFPVSYAQEWKTGFAQKRIDSLCKLLPLKDAGTVHIDAFHTWPPLPTPDANGNVKIDLSRKVISPFLPFTVADETEAQQNIFNYWASKGIDVTSEGTDFLRDASFEGLQPMAWWFTGLENYKRWPSSIYTGGVDRSDWGRLFGTSIHGEDIVKKDKLYLQGFKEQFCLNTVIWYYLNRLDRKYFLSSDNYKSVGFSNNIISSLTANGYLLTSNNDTLAYNNNLFLPAPWVGENNIVAYTKAGYKNINWKLPQEFSSRKNATIYRVDDNGKKKIATRKIISNKIILSLKADEIVLLELR